MRAYYDDYQTVVLESYRDDDIISFKGVQQTIESNKIVINDLSLGQYHYLESKHFGKVLIETRFIVKSEFFDRHYTDFDRKLGSYLDQGQTVFCLWAPTAIAVHLVLEDVTYEMERDAKGFYSHTLDGEHNGLVYRYAVEINEHVTLCCDPYAKATLPNRAASVVADLVFDKVDLDTYDDSILELHVRDFTMDPAVDFKQRGKLLGLLESVGEFGMNHILDLGVGMIQVQPLTDFETVDELNPFARYNWGYDPMQFFALEGSYSSNIKDPLQVLRDLVRVVNTYHKHNIAFSMDVVYNHIYEVEGSSLNACVPYYYFRYVDGVLSDGTFCGNEIASEFTMVRKLIVDACVYFVDCFGIDGYRFDLMGISDIETMNMIRKRLDPKIRLYGEGWNMASGLEESKRATMQNHRLLPGYQFFNDGFRDLIGGPLDGSGSGIYGSEASEAIDLALNGSLDFFDTPAQSINYVECHDNYTMADKLALQNLGVDGAMLYLEAVILAKGTCFMQIGQSFYRNKQGVENSYQSSDAINAIRWQQLSVYRDLNASVKAFLARRKNNPERLLNWDGVHICI